jgi:hypothetical protein
VIPPTKPQDSKTNDHLKHLNQKIQGWNHLTLAVPKLGQQETGGEKVNLPQDSALLDPLLLLNPFSCLPLVLADWKEGIEREGRREDEGGVLGKREVGQEKNGGRGTLSAEDRRGGRLGPGRG